MRALNFSPFKRGRSFVQNWELAQGIDGPKKRLVNKRLGLLLGLFIFLAVIFIGGVFLISKHKKANRVIHVSGLDQEQSSPSPSVATDSFLEMKNKFSSERVQVERSELKENIFKFPKIDWQIKLGDI